MQETIACPECKRRLVLPDGQRGNVVQCPACRARFLPGSAGPGGDDGSPGGHRLFATGPEERRVPETRRQGPDDLPRRVRRKPARRRAGWAVLFAWVGGLVVLLGAGGLFVFVARPIWSPGRVVVPEEDEERREEVRAAFAEQNPADDEEVEELRGLFLSLGLAFRAADGERIAGFFDLDRMAEEFNGLLAPAQRSARTRREFARGLRQVWGKTMAQQAPLLAWTDFEIRAVKNLADDEAVVIVRHEDGKGTTSKMRWWVVRRDGAWKVYDLENLDSGMRTSTTAALMMAGGGVNVAAVGGAIESIRQATQALALDQDLDDAERKLRGAAVAGLPKPIEALRWMLEGSIRLRRGRPAEALEALARASALHPDMPILDLLRGAAYNQLGRWAEALKHLEAYRDLLGDDAQVCAQIGESLRELRRFDEAAVAYRKSLDKNPRDADVYHGLLRSLGDDAAKDAGPRFARLASPRASYEALAEDCERRKVYDILAAITQAMRKIDPAFAPAGYYLALGKARSGQADEAVASYKAALAGQPDAAKKKAYTDGFLAAMASGGKYAEAYVLSPTRDAFRLLAAKAMKGYRRDELKRLVDLRAKDDAADPLLPAYRGQVLADQGLYEAADAAFTQALALAPDEDVLAPFRSTRVLARYHAGKALSAYREIGPRDETFLQLVTIAFYANHDDRLRELLDAHARKEPDGLDLARFRLRLRVRQKNVPEAVALFRKILGRRLAEDKRTQLVSEFLTDMVNAGLPVEGYKAAPDAEKAFAQVAEELTDEDRFDELPRLIAAHRLARPADAALLYYQGEVSSHEGRWGEAEKLLREGMRKAPEGDRDRFRYKFVYAAYKNGHGLAAYKEAGPPEKTFSQLAHLMAADKKGTDLEALLAAHRPHVGKGERTRLLVAEIDAKIFTGKFAEAAETLRRSMTDEPGEHARRTLTARFLAGMATAGRPLEGYRAAPDKRAAFDTLASSLLSAKKDGELAALLDEHAKAHADDPLVPFFRGELLLLRGDAARAEPLFAAAFAKKTPANLWRLRGGLFKARVKLGKAVATYRQVEPGPATFAQLASQCLEAKDAKQLRALIDVHRKAHPEDANLPLWDLEALWLDRDYEGVVKRVAANRAEFAPPAVRSRADAYLVRALVRLKRPQDAVREAERVMASASSQPLLLVLAHASSGDVEEAIAALERTRPAPYLLRTCYDDEDLGPILKGEAFEELREEFPRPAERK